jgi:hypothetical protein
MERPAPFDSQCGRCALPMEMVVTIEPFAGQPGLHAYVCSKCGSTRSRLIPPNMPQPTKGPVAQRQEQVQPKEEDVQDNELANLRRPIRWQNSEQN